MSRNSNNNLLRPLVPALGALALAAGAHAQDRPHEGVEVSIMTFTGPQIAEPLQRRAPQFEELTGAEINVITVPFSDLYTQLLNDWATGTNSVDAAVFAPQWMVDYIQGGYLEDITARVEADEAIRWEDIVPFFREFSAQYDERIYLVPLDGDFQMVYYRTDVLEELGMEPPRTWEDYLAIAEAAHGMDMNGDGSADYGSCISKKRNAQAYWAITSIAAAYIQVQGTRQGAFFDPETMEPLVDNPGFRRGLEVYKQTTDFGPPDEINLDVGDTRALFTSGRCALSLDWGDIGVLAKDPEESRVAGRWGAIILPGTDEVYDRDAGAMVACNTNTCPHAADGVNHAPFAAFGGWSGGINAAAGEAVKDAAYDFFSFVSRPENSNVDVTLGRTGFNPYRRSHFESVDFWVEAGMQRRQAQSYLGAIRESLDSPNMVLDLRIPQNRRYQQVVLDTTLARMLAGELGIEETMETVYQGWQELNEELGVERQREAYRRSLSIR